MHVEESALLLVIRLQEPKEQDPARQLERPQDFKLNVRYVLQDRAVVPAHGA